CVASPSSIRSTSAPWQVPTRSGICDCSSANPPVSWQLCAETEGLGSARVASSTTRYHLIRDIMALLRRRVNCACRAQDWWLGLRSRDTHSAGGCPTGILGCRGGGWSQDRLSAPLSRETHCAGRCHHNRYLWASQAHGPSELARRTRYYLVFFWHAWHRPANSSVCVSTRNLSCSASRRISASTPVASTGTTLPQALHSRWWWWPSSHSV